MANWCLFILILIIITLAAIIILSIYSREEPKRGGYEDDIEKIIKMMKPYIKEVGHEHIEKYLEDYYDMSAGDIRALRKERTKLEVPKDLQYLAVLVEDIFDQHELRNEYDFIKKSDLTYASFLPDSKAALLFRARGKVDSTNLKRVRDALDDFLTKEDIHLSSEKLKKEAQKFLKYHKLFKFKASRAEWPMDKLAKALKSDPDKVLDVDILGILPDLRKHARWLKEKKTDKRAIKQIRRSLTDLGLLRSYPEFTWAGIWTLDDLADRLRDIKYHETWASEAMRAKREKERAQYELGAERRRREQETIRREQETIQREQEKIEEAKARSREAAEAREREEAWKHIDPNVLREARETGMSDEEIYQMYKEELAKIRGADEQGDAELKELLTKRIKKEIKKRK